MKYLYKSSGTGMLALGMLLTFLLPLSLLAQDVKQFPLNKIRKNHYLYVIGGEDNNGFTSSTRSGQLLIPAMRFGSSMLVSIDF